MNGGMPAHMPAHMLGARVHAAQAGRQAPMKHVCMSGQADWQEDGQAGRQAAAPVVLLRAAGQAAVARQGQHIKEHVPLAASHIAVASSNDVLRGKQRQQQQQPFVCMCVCVHVYADFL